MSIGQRLKDARKKRGMSQDMLADKIGASRGVITNIEHDKIQEPQPLVINAICNVLNINREWLLTGTGDMPQKDNDNNILDMIDRIMSGENEFHKNLFKTFAQLDEKELAALESILDRFLKVQKSDTTALFSASDIPDTPEELERLCPPIEFGKDDAV